MNLKKNTSDQGFTLIEMVIAMTILALVVVVLYLAFSSAGRIWTRQQLRSGEGEREAALVRLLSDDLEKLVPYSYSWEKGQGFFFALGSRALFYATTSGFGSRQRGAQGIYFACCYLEKDAAGEGDALYLIKTWGPNIRLLDALAEFSRNPAGSLDLDEQLRESALLVLDGLGEAGFAVIAQPEKLDLSGGAQAGGALVEDEALPRNWSHKLLPGAVFFSYSNREGVPRRFLLPLMVPPEPLHQGRHST
ncbi:MAG TPA: prepilin-type N-terminal cleavage/methylation domain-containing protein [Proteobacteria bacterium]|nr:prepilin-type N-terminal cleavage/methylation domain-containing protein [Pseudomonadota bacterium]